jgi:hypothetical protein
MRKATVRKRMIAARQTRKLYKKAIKASDMQTDYAVYIFHHANKNQKNSAPWERKHTTTNMNSALQEAQALYDTQKYQRVEVKRQYFDAKRACKLGDTLKTYDSRREIPFFIVAKIALIVLICALASLSVYGLYFNMATGPY